MIWLGHVDPVFDLDTGASPIIRSELTRDDCRWLNEQMELAGSPQRYVDRLRPPVGPAGTSSPRVRAFDGTRTFDIQNYHGRVVAQVAG